MSEISETIIPVEEPTENLCECGKPTAHWGMCGPRARKAAATKKARRESASPAPVTSLPEVSAPVIAFFHLHCEGDHVKLQLTGGTVDELKESLVVMGRALGFAVEVRSL